MRGNANAENNNAAKRLRRVRPELIYNLHNADTARFWKEKRHKARRRRERQTYDYLLARRDWPRD